MVRVIRVVSIRTLAAISGAGAYRPVAADDEKCVQVSEALDRLAAVDERKAQVVKLHLFTGLELREIATVLDTSEKTVQRDWTFAKAWLSRELKAGA